VFLKTAPMLQTQKNQMPHKTIHLDAFL